MTKSELRQLRVQLVMMGALFAACIAASAAVPAFDWAFHTYLCRERYAPTPAELRRFVEAAEQGRLDRGEFDRLAPEGKVAIYRDWMSRSGTPPRATPGTLMAAAPEVYGKAVERTLICGRADQRERALEFLELAGDAGAIPMLQRVGRWWMRRNLPVIAERIQMTIGRLEQTAAGRPPASAELSPVFP
ncbi:MAG: hypothetical protein NUV77_19515 [Thermoguttaceae bacterium]|jgi:hypothetical protein|nr:hypothetical protein [Thermoguttaceae bacterium]